jgi:hypothetical protein
LPEDFDMKQKIMEVLEAENLHLHRSAKLDSDQFLKYVRGIDKERDGIIED